MPHFFTTGHLRLSILLAILGALVAFIFTWASDSGVVALIARPVVSALIMFAVGSAVFALLASKVPEAIEAIENQTDEALSPMGDLAADGEPLAMGDGAGSDISEMGGADGGSEAYDSGMGGGGSRLSDIPRKTGVQIGKDEITVNGVKFKNQPEVMAETIKQLMEQDKE